MEMLKKSHFPDVSHTSGGRKRVLITTQYMKKVFPAGKTSQNKTRKASSTQHGKKNQILLPELLLAKGIHCPDKAGKEGMHKKLIIDFVVKFGGSQSPQN